MADLELLSINEWNADGVRTIYEINFAGGYIDREHVVAWAYDGRDADGLLTGGVELAFDWVGNYQIGITPAVAAGKIVRIYRDTPADLPIVNFSDGSIINEKTLDVNAEQAVFLAAELRDRFATQLDADRIGYWASVAQEAAEDAEEALEQVQITVMDAMPTYTVRNAFNAQRAAVRPNGTLANIAGQLYKVDNSAVGSLSCTNDLGVSGLIPAYEVTPYHFGAVGNDTANDTVALFAADLYASSVARPLHLHAGTYRVTGERAKYAKWVGLDRKRSVVHLVEGKLYPALSDTGFKDIELRADGFNITGLRGPIEITAYTLGYEIDNCLINWQAILGAGYHPGNQRRLIQISNSQGFTVKGSTLRGGSLWFSDNNSRIRVQDNHLWDHAARYSDDLLKLSQNSDEAIVTGNVFENCIEDGIDTYVNGRRLIIANNLFKNIGRFGMQIKTVFTWPIQNVSSTDLFLRTGQMVVLGNLMYDFDCSKALPAEQAGAILIHHNDTRFEPVLGTSAGSGGMVRINVPSMPYISNGDLIRVEGVKGTTEANGVYAASVVGSGLIDLPGTTYTNAFAPSLGAITKAWAITGAVAGTGGVVRLTAAGAGDWLRTNNVVKVSGVAGTTEANVSDVRVTVINSNTIELHGVAFSNAYTSGGYISLYVTAKDQPDQCLVSNNVIDNINTARICNNATGIHVSGINCHLSNNSVTRVWASAGAPQHGASGLIIGKLTGNRPAVVPTAVSVTGGSYWGEKCGIAFNGIIDGCTVSSCTVGVDKVNGLTSTFGVIFVGAYDHVGLSFDSCQITGTGRSILCSVGGGAVIRDWDISSCTLNGIFEVGATSLTGLNWSGGKVNGAILLGGSGTASRDVHICTRVTYDNTSAAAVRLNGVTGVVIDGSFISGGNRSIQMTNCSQYSVSSSNLRPTGIAITGAVSNGGAIQVTSVGHGMVTGAWVWMNPIPGVLSTGGFYRITADSVNVFTLQGSTFSGSYGGTANLYRLIDHVGTAGFGYASNLLSY